MEIRFCDRCTESIPDADFDSGRAVTVSGRHYHVACALTRSLSLTGPRAWLTFVLALYAAGLTTFLLVRSFGEKEAPTTVPAVVAARIDEAAADTARVVSAERDRRLADAETKQARALQAEGAKIREEVQGHLEVMGARIDETDRMALDRVSALADKVARNEKELSNLSALLRAVVERAEREIERRAPVEPPPPQPAPEPKPEPEPAPPVETPQPEPTPADADLKAEVDRWIERLKDPNENIRFSATLELGRLKDLRATAPLVETLQDDRDYYVRLGAATALGDMRAADAVPALVEALDDKDTLVRTAANDALQAVTGHAIEFLAEMSSRERRKAQRDWRDWWKDNEAEVRGRLGQ